MPAERPPLTAPHAAPPRPATRAQKDAQCACCSLIVHSLHLVTTWPTVPARDLAPLLALQLLAALTIAGLAARWAGRGQGPHLGPGLGQHSPPVSFIPAQGRALSTFLPPAHIGTCLNQQARMHTCARPLPQARAVHQGPPSVHRSSAPGPAVPAHGHAGGCLQSGRGPRSRRPAAPAGLARAAGQPHVRAVGDLLQPLRAAAASGALGHTALGSSLAALAGHIPRQAGPGGGGLACNTWRPCPAPLRRWASASRR